MNGMRYQIHLLQLMGALNTKTFSHAGKSTQEFTKFAGIIIINTTYLPKFIYTYVK